MPDFKVGDKVYLSGDIVSVGKVACDVELTNERIFGFLKIDLIPASRVIVTKARRAAEFPKDWGKVVSCSKKRLTWFNATLVGYDEKGKKWIVADQNNGLVTCDVAEVEE